jgi:hypothetical protein
VPRDEFDKRNTAKILPQKTSSLCNAPLKRNALKKKLK